ncbi:MAG: rhodanese-like domain-containing protein [bacterium]|nr:rhodanese-like domain-containing protein [bacterium]
MKKKKLNLAIKEAMLILVIAVVLGMVVNLFHPNHVQIATRRPSLKFAPDTMLAQDLPGVSFSSDQEAEDEKNEQITEPMLITTEQVLQLIAGEMALLLDARSKAEFEKSHIPGAQNVPYPNLSLYQARLDSLPDDQWLVCYCDGPPCQQAESLAAELIKSGHGLVAVYFDGLNGWKASGQEIEGKEAAKIEN